MTFLVVDDPVMSARAHEALYESEAALRLVDQEISDLRADGLRGDGLRGDGLRGDGLRGDGALSPPSLVDVPSILLQANVQIVEVLTQLRSARTAFVSMTGNDAATSLHTHAAAALTDIEERLADVARRFEATLDDDMFTAIRQPAA